MFWLLIFSFLSFESYGNQSSIHDKSWAEFQVLNFAEEKIHGAFKARSTWQNQGKYWGWKADVGGQAFSYFDYVITAPEVYVAYSAPGLGLWTLGRKVPEQSLTLDQDWSLGVGQAFNRVQPLEPEAQGKMGVFYQFDLGQIESGRFTMELFGSPLFLPDQTADYSFEQGKVESPNPWAILPPQYFALEEGEEFFVYYKIENDHLPKLLLVPQYSADLAFQKKGWKLSAHYAYRPSKQLSFFLNPRLSTDVVGRLDVAASPLFEKEHFYGAQAEHKGKFHTVYLGYHQLRPDPENKKDYKTSLFDYDFFSAGVNLELSRRFKTGLSYLNVKSHEIKEPGVVYIPTTRFWHESALKWSAGLKFNSKYALKWNARYLFKDKLTWLFLGAEAQISECIWLHGGVHLLKAFSKISEEEFKGSSFVSWSHLDHMQLGVRYVF